MIRHPAILSLLISSAIIAVMTLFAGVKGYAILRHWDLRSGSERQLQLERETYLISAILAYMFGFQLISLFLYIFTADYLHALLVGAMCAAGVLNANGLGYPLLLLKIITCVGAGVWLIINHADAKGYDYPLIRPKYAALLTIVPLIVAESVLLFVYFGSLKAQVITSCCGSLFSTEAANLSSDLAALPRMPMMVVLTLSIVASCVCGIVFRKTGKGGLLFAGTGAVTFVISVASLVSFISVYVYELPTHHCPFCILHREYGWIGYPLYGALLVAVICALGVGALMPARELPSLTNVAPGIQRKLATVSTVMFLLFGIAALWLVARSNLTF